MEFAFKELLVWQKAIDFADKILDAIENIYSSRKHYRIIEQIEASSISISNNIAEGKGRNSQKEFVQFLYIARGSLYETVSMLTLFKRRGWIKDVEYNQFEIEALEIVKMIKGLINSLYK
jgi:four helix bundle protein